MSYPKGMYRNPYGCRIDVVETSDHRRLCVFLEHPYIPTPFSSWESPEVLGEYGYVGVARGNYLEEDKARGLI